MLHVPFVFVYSMSKLSLPRGKSGLSIVFCMTPKSSVNSFSSEAFSMFYILQFGIKSLIEQFLGFIIESGCGERDFCDGRIAFHLDEIDFELALLREGFSVGVDIHAYLLEFDHLGIGSETGGERFLGNAGSDDALNIRPDEVFVRGCGYDGLLLFGGLGSTCPLPEHAASPIAAIMQAQIARMTVKRVF